ncbi:MAG TPA: hypothetical protein VNF26_08220 [Candidatus Baltobacterales bacterium]|nr:hypothetical protein [Candidatus Baltobacterales bacterium]
MIQTRERVDLLLENAQLREQLGRHDEDQVELAAQRCFRAYRMMGGHAMTLASWRARVRELLT